MDRRSGATTSSRAARVGRLRLKGIPLIWLVVLAVAVTVYFLPHGGQSCDQIGRCTSQVSLELGDLSDSADDWQVGPRGLTLSPDESEAAVVLRSESLSQSRLLIFGMDTGERLAELVNDGADHFWNPTYSNDGTLIAATNGLLNDRATTARGGVAIWDRATGELRSNHYAWSWTKASDGEWSDWLYDPASKPLIDEYFEWEDCRGDVGFSNDGLYINCDGGLQAVHLETDQTVAAYAYEPGFNTLPAGAHASFGRVIYDPGVTRPSGLVVRNDKAFFWVPRSQEDAVDLEGGSWQVTSTAISGDDRVGAVTREYEPGQLGLATPRRFRPAGELYLIDMTTGSRLHNELDVTPTAGRFSLAGNSYVLATDDLRIMIFDTELL